MAVKTVKQKKDEEAEDTSPIIPSDAPVMGQLVDDPYGENIDFGRGQPQPRQPMNRPQVQMPAPDKTIVYILFGVALLFGALYFFKIQETTGLLIDNDAISLQLNGSQSSLTELESARNSCQQSLNQFNSNYSLMLADATKCSVEKSSISTNLEGCRSEFSSAAAARDNCTSSLMGVLINFTNCSDIVSQRNALNDSNNTYASCLQNATTAFSGFQINATFGNYSNVTAYLAVCNATLNNQTNATNCSAVNSSLANCTAGYALCNATLANTTAALGSLNASYLFTLNSETSLISQTACWKCYNASGYMNYFYNSTSHAMYCTNMSWYSYPVNTSACS